MEIDEILEQSIYNNRKNIQIYMCCYDITQADLTIKLNRNKSSISKNVTGYDHVTKPFIEDFCVMTNLDPKLLNM